MEEKRVAEYFVVAGLPEENRKPLDGFSDDTILKTTYKQDPIVDITIINKGQGETPPGRYRCIELTPTGLPADLNHGSIRYPEMYICYRRGRDKPPITDIGVLYDGKEKISPGCDAVTQTPYGRSANVNNSSSNHIYITYRRAMDKASSDTLSVMDICIIIASKGEAPPHAFMVVDKTLNKSMMGSTVLICYKKSMAKNDFLAYKPGILGRYPLDDHSDFPLAHNVPMFCLPLGATIEAWSADAQHPLPKFSTFVLTQETGGKVYGAAVMFYEEFDANTLTPQQQIQLGLITSPTRKERSTSKTLHHSKSICLLSRWPFFSTFKTFLHYLYRISISGTHPVPLERYITHFLNEVPFPTPQRPRIQVELNFNTISLYLPEESPLPQSGASYITLLKHLGSENCMNVLLYTLMEHKLLIHSLCPAVLTSAAEAISHMIFPFHWNCPYIPMCPLGLSEYLCAPTPFIVGVDSRYFDLFDPPHDVTCVDLDTNTVSVAEDKRGCSSYKIMPKKLVKQLRTSLEKLHELCCLESYEGGPIDTGFETYPVDQELLRRKKRLQMDTAIQEAFLRFMVSLLKGYKNHLLPITQQPNQMTTDFTARFDVQGFIKSRDKTYQKFYNMLKDTQNFTSFIQERSFVSDKDASLEFFDECVEKMEEGREDVRLVEFEDSCKSERTVVLTPPEPAADGKVMHYTSFPKLNPALFPQRPVPQQLKVAKHSAPCPNSPMTKRTKQEIRIGQKLAKKLSTMSDLWAKCLLWHCYSLWFVHLPSYVKAYHSKTQALRIAYEVLGRMQNSKLNAPDEVCYRVLMQLCGQYHQPVLAVKVFSDLRQMGIEPNAMTYGYYNKAVLESKWPSSNSAYLRWCKIRNTVMAIAQFRQVIKVRRRRSMCSGTESDLDKISRASIDSYLDDGSGDKPDGTKVVRDLVNVDGHSSEEKSSTGGMSDRGYSSMTMEDAKRISIVIGSQDSIDSVGKQKNDTAKAANGTVQHGNNTRSSHSQKVVEQSKAEGVAATVATLPPHSDPCGQAPNLEAPTTTSMVTEALGVTVDDRTQDQSSHIVRRSIEGGSCSSFRDDRHSSLMMTNDTLEDTVFQNASAAEDIAKLADQTTDEPRPLSGESLDTDKLVPTPHAMSKGSSNDSGIVNAGSTDLLTSSRTDSDSVSSSGVQTLSTGEMTPLTSSPQGQQSSVPVIIDVHDPLSPVPSNLPSPLIKEPSVSEGPLVDVLSSGDVSTVSDSGVLVSVPKTSPDSTTERSMVSESSTMSNNSTLQSEDLLTSKGQSPLTSDQPMTADESVLLEDSFVSPLGETQHSGETSPTRSLTSPSHSIRTPVTENDPLGLFMLPTLSAVASAPVIAGSMTLQPAELRGSNASLDHPEHKTCSRNLLIDLQPFGGTSTPVHNQQGSSARMSKPVLHFSGASSPDSPVESWSPLSARSEPPHMPGEASPAATRKSSTLPAHHKASADDQALSKMSTPQRRSGKTPSRSESFSSAFRSVTSRMANKFTEFKQSMATPPRSGLGSSGSLHHPDIDRLITEEEQENSHMRKAGSLDFLGGQGDAGASASQQAASQSSLDDVQGQNSKSGRLAMPTLLNKASHLWALGAKVPQNAALKDWASKLGSMTESLKTSLKESFSLGDDFTDSDEDDDYYYKTADNNSQSSSATKEDDGSLHDYDKGGMIQSILEPRDDTDRGSDRVSLDRLSLRGTATTAAGFAQNLPQMLVNVAVEVEMCSLSRCQTCKCLLYDEEIMSGWTPDDSDLNTTCSFCAYKFVPTLQVYVKDYRHCTKPTVVSPSQSAESIQSSQSASRSTCHAHCNGTHRSMTSLTSIDNKSVDSAEVLTETAADTSQGFMNDSSPNLSMKKSHKNPVTRTDSAPSSISTSSAHSATCVHSNPPQTDKPTSEETPVANNLIQLSPPPSPQKEASGSEGAVEQGEAGEDPGESGDDANKCDCQETNSNSENRETQENMQRSCVSMEPICVPYLSPLVLRKELETVLEQDGDKCLNSADFVDGHPILYWNLLWYFRRLDVPSHFPGFLLAARTTNSSRPVPACWAGADSRHVSIRTVWDHAHMHSDLGYPLYLLWKKAERQAFEATGAESIIDDPSEFNIQVLAKVLGCVREDDLLTPIQLIMQERQTLREKGRLRFRSIYRELLFLTVVAFRHDSVVDLDLFDREYRAALHSLPSKEAARTHVCDTAPAPKTIMCRRAFMNLEL